MFNQPYPGAPGSLRGMGSNPQQRPAGNQILTALPAIRDMVRQGPAGVYANMYQSNPRFREFADSMSGKSPEEAFREAGFDYEGIKQLMRSIR